MNILISCPGMMFETVNILKTNLLWPVLEPLRPAIPIRLLVSMQLTELMLYLPLVNQNIYRPY